MAYRGEAPGRVRPRPESEIRRCWYCNLSVIFRDGRLLDPVEVDGKAELVGHLCDWKRVPRGRA